MKNKILFPTMFLLLLLSFAGAAQSLEAVSITKELRELDNQTFAAGEYLEYRVHWGSVTAGTARLYIKDKPVTLKGRECLHIVGTGITSKVFSAFYNVNDRYETFLDTKSLIPWKFKRKIEEGTFKNYIEVDFDHHANKAHQRRNMKKEVETYDVPDNIQDVLSAFFYARTQDYSNAKIGDITRFQNFIDRKIYDLDVEYQGKEVITIGRMKYNCVKLKPLVQEGGLFQHEGDMFLWISDDENRIPIRVESAIVIGSVQVDLVKTENLKHPLLSRVR